MSQGWHESRNKVMHFHQCQVNIPRTLNQLSDHIDLITKEKTTKLNPMAMPYVHEGEDAEKNNDSRDEGSAANDASEKKNDVKQNCNNKGDCDNKWMCEGRIFRFIQKMNIT